MTRILFAAATALPSSSAPWRLRPPSRRRRRARPPTSCTGRRFRPAASRDLSARHQQVVLKKKCPAIDTVIQYKAGAGGALLWSQTNTLPADGVNVVGINLPHMVLQPMEGNVSYKTDDVTPVFWFHYTPDLLVVHEAGADQDLRRLPQGREGRPGQAQPRRLGPQLGQPRRARAAEPRLRRQDDVRAVQGHRRPRPRRPRRPHRRRDDVHAVRDRQQGQGAAARGGDGDAPPAPARRADLQGARRRLGRRRLPRHRRAEGDAAGSAATPVRDVRDAQRRPGDEGARRQGRLRARQRRRRRHGRVHADANAHLHRRRQAHGARRTK